MISERGGELNADVNLKYVIFLHAVEGQTLSRELHSAHAEHLKELDRRGILVLAGPFIEHNSGMIVINAASKNKAVKIAETDPFIIQGYRTYEVRTLESCCKASNYRKPD
ncbi:MAG: hypothetical protein GF310_02195 [candidate division Zixibacteria bacterium]|nr:hypothetical protein [candidate division Zixibacteria bacterium]